VRALARAHHARECACNTVKVHTRSISTKRANRLFRTHGLSGSSGLQDIAAETRKRVNASTLSLTSIRLVRHRINGIPQFPSTPSRSCATPVHPCHFVWQDSNDRRSIIRESSRAYMTITLTYLGRKRGSLVNNCLFFHSLFRWPLKHFFSLLGSIFFNLLICT